MPSAFNVLSHLLSVLSSVLCSFALTLWFLRHQLRYFVDHRPSFDILLCLHAVERTGTSTVSHASHMYKLSNKRSTYVQHIAVLRVSSLGACLRKICNTRMGMKGDLCNLPHSKAGFGPDLEPVLYPVRSYPLTRLHL